MDEDGFLWVRGCITHSNLGMDVTHPFLILVNHHVAMLLIRHHHERIKHQGRHIIEALFVKMVYGWVQKERSSALSINV